MWSIVRMTASVLAARLDFSFEDVEDLRLAVTELCATCAVGALVDARCEARFEISDDCFEMHLEVSPVIENDPATSDQRIMGMLELSSQILRATVDDHAVEPLGNAVRRGHLRKDCDPAALR